MLGTITNPEQGPLMRPDYIAWRAQKHNTTEQVVRDAIHRCEKGDSDFPEDYPEALYEMSYSICEDIAASGGEVDPVIEEQVHQHVHAAPETAPESPEALEVLPPIPNTEGLVLRGAMETTLENGGYSRLSEIYSFHDGMTNIRTKDGVIETPEHAGMLMGLGADMGKKGIWLCIQGAQRLLVGGHSQAMEQVCATLKLSPQSIYNYCGSLPYATPQARKLLQPAVLVEICRSRYSDDDSENDRIKKEMVEEAIKDGWNTPEARSHAKMRKGDETPVEGKPTQKERVKTLESTIQNIISILENQDISEANRIDAVLDAARNILD